MKDWCNWKKYFSIFKLKLIFLETWFHRNRLNYSKISTRVFLGAGNFEPVGCFWIFHFLFCSFKENSQTSKTTRGLFLVEDCSLFSPLKKILLKKVSKAEKNDVRKLFLWSFFCNLLLSSKVFLSREISETRSTVKT